MTTPFAENVDPVPVPTRAERTENAKQFLKENPTEIIACAARIYDLTETTLYSSIKRQKDEKTRREGHNKILSQDETDAIHDLIRSFPHMWHSTNAQSDKEMKKQGVFIPTELMTPIADPEAE
jgi:hypothetical protein